jgi:predicted DNA binding CopG/RHH family protein
LKAVQYFSDEALQRSKDLTPFQIVSFIENYRKLHSMNHHKTESKLISIKIPVDLLAAFKIKAASEGVKYQTKIKELMKEFL